MSLLTEIIFTKSINFLIDRFISIVCNLYYFFTDYSK